MTSRPGQLTDVAYLVLLALTTPRHDYLIMSKIEKITGGDVRMGPASLYTTCSIYASFIITLRS